MSRLFQLFPRCYHISSLSYLIGYQGPVWSFFSRLRNNRFYGGVAVSRRCNSPQWSACIPPCRFARLLWCASPPACPSCVFLFLCFSRLRSYLLLIDLVYFLFRKHDTKSDVCCSILYCCIFYICFILVIKIKIAIKWFTAFVIYLLLFIYKDLFKYVLDTRFIKGRYLWWSSPLCLLSIFIHLYFWNSYLYTHICSVARGYTFIFFLSWIFPVFFFLLSLSFYLSISFFHLLVYHLCLLLFLLALPPCFWSRQIWSGRHSLEFTPSVIIHWQLALVSLPSSDWHKGATDTCAHCITILLP